jgi:hypothetical protein
VSEHTSQQTEEQMIPVRVTGYSHEDPPTDLRKELEAAMERGGLVLRRADPGLPRWFATQGELDTPHTTFRLSPR